MKIYTNEEIKKIKDRKKKINKVIRIVLTPIFLIIALICIYICYQKFIQKKENIDLFGFKSFIVLTGSMEPNLNINDLIVVKGVKEEDIKVGDIITFHEKNSVQTVTHRVIEIKNENGKVFYRTKGDNNNTADKDPVTYNEIDGKILFKLDKFGVIVTELFTGTGLIVLFLFLFISYYHSSRMEDRMLAREDARKLYNYCKYKKDD